MFAGDDLCVGFDLVEFFIEDFDLGAEDPRESRSLTRRMTSPFMTSRIVSLRSS